MRHQIGFVSDWANELKEQTISWGLRYGQPMRPGCANEILG